MNRVRFLLKLIALASSLCWASVGDAQTTVKDDGLVKLTKTILQKASENGFPDLNSSRLLYEDSEPGESVSDQLRRKQFIELWADSLRRMERAVTQESVKFKGLSYKNFVVSREVDEKGKSIPVVKVRFSVPGVARDKVDPPGVDAIEWRLTFVQNDRPKKDRLKGEPDMLLLRIDLVTPTSVGGHF